jgi:DNA-binding NarL/FixJ family response regulator
MIRVVIVDSQDSDRNDSALVLSAQSDFEIVGMGKDGYEAIKLVDDFRPDIILLDINLSYIDGINAASIVKRRFPHTAVIILTCLDDDASALDAVCSGVSGYLLKNRDMENLPDLIRVVHEGGCFISPQVAAKILPEVSRIARGDQPSVHNLPANLSKTELEIIHHVSRGLENHEIAEKLYLTMGTVRNHITMILQKTALRNRTQLAVFAVRNGLLRG